MTTATPFSAGYAGHYDLFYAQKEYAAECDYLEALFTRYADTPVRTILDLGCGTGSHALAMAQRGYTVVGVDRAPAMLEQARRKQAEASNRTLPLTFVEGDVRSLALDQRVDAIIMMFAVLGYQVSNDDLAATLAAVKRHLCPGGLFVADFWYGPAVLRHGPSDRVHEHAVNGERVLRLVKASLDATAHKVDVYYHVLRLQGPKVVEETEEEHAMRFFFPLELRYMAQVAGLQTLHLGEFLAPDAPLTDEPWNAVGVWKVEG